MSQKHFSLKAKAPYTRIDHFLNELITSLSRSQIAKLIKDNHIKLNGRTVKKKNLPIIPGDIVEVEIEIREAEAEAATYRPSLSLDAIKLYEDDYLLIIDKPRGISMHPGSGAREETILDVFRYHYPRMEGIETGADERPGIVHRLDKETSGVVILAKDQVTMKRLQKQFKRRQVKKTYMALVSGSPRYRNGTIDVPLARSQRNRTRFRAARAGDERAGAAREAVTHYTVIRQYSDFSLVKAFPLTGRTHQIRVHFAHLGNPILGDPVYGKAHTFERLALHAYSIEFYHPVTNQKIISYSPFPGVFREFIKKNHRT
jgi:23S rRNA pseudouridine1911/1915/1917 synthase